MTERIRDLIEREQFFNGHHPKASTIQAPTIGFKRMSPDAILPTKAHKSDSGYDLYASDDVIIEPGDTVIVPTSIAVVLPKGYEATVRPRSGVTSKTKLRVQLGTIDNGFMGGIGVIVDNIEIPQEYHGVSYAPYGIDGKMAEVQRSMHGNPGNYLIRKGDRIGQLVVTKLPQLEVVEVLAVEETARGVNGFGSSGV